MSQRQVVVLSFVVIGAVMLALGVYFYLQGDKLTALVMAAVNVCDAIALPLVLSKLPQT